MQCLELPKSTPRELDKIHRDFFWKNSSNEKGMSMVSGDKVCRPKKLGGLGFRKAEATNQAFLAKLGWRILSESNTLWTSLVNNKYLKKDEFLTRKTRNSDSWAWKKISKARLLLSKGII